MKNLNKSYKFNKTRLYEGLIQCLISIFFLSLCLIENSDFKGENFALSPYLFLFISCFLLFAIGLYNIFSCFLIKPLKNEALDCKDVETADLKKQRNLKILIFLAINALFVVLLNFIGFYSLSLIYLIAVELLFEKKKVIGLLIYNFIALIVIYVFFEKLLFINLSSNFDMVKGFFELFEGLL